MSHGVQRLLRIGRNTRELGRAVAFYRDALGFTVTDPGAPPPDWTKLAGVHARPSHCARLALGAQELELTEFPDAAPYPQDSASCDLWFQHCAIVVADMDAAYRRLVAQEAVPITRGGPQRLPPATGSVTAFKVRDPDGHPLELIAFPEGIGDPQWQIARSGNAPTLGIDHSAISVRDVERSILFYERLGLGVAARGVNRGAEQRRLDDLRDVEVDVVALQARSRTPHLELLGYRHPHGRPAQRWKPTATAADRLEWSCRGLELVLDAIAAAGFAGAVLADDFAGGQRIALLRDPDGHLVQLTAAGA